MMKVLIVASNNKGCFAPFVIEQVEALRDCGCEVDFFGVSGKGLSGYLKNRSSLKNKIKAFQPDVIHAHYGLSGLLANLQCRVPVVTTYHGSDINDPKVFRFSRMAMRLSAWNIFVSRGIMNKAKATKKCSLIPCGVAMEKLQPLDKTEAREVIKLLPDKKYVLFASAFDNAVKDAPLAFEVVQLIRSSEVQLLELKGYTREEVNRLLCAVDALLMTSFNEGSPQVIKEAMACGCPIVSVDVGDVKERVNGLDGCFVAQSREPHELAELLQKVLSFEGRTEGRERLVADGLDNKSIARRLVKIYEKVSRNGNR